MRSPLIHLAVIRKKLTLAMRGSSQCGICGIASRSKRSAPSRLRDYLSAMSDVAPLSSHDSNDVDNSGIYLCTSIMSGGMIQLRIIDDCPWTHVLALVPFSQQIFISGSAATWLAERCLLQVTPNWSPNDIDVFASLPSDDFEDMVARYVDRHAHCAISVVRRQGRHDVVDVTMSNCQYTKSFIRCPIHFSARDVVHQFDIDICTPIIIHEDGALWVKMSQHVASSIRDRRMHCIVRKRNPEYLSYPFKKTLNRLHKYVARGYVFDSLTFESVTRADIPLREEDCTLNVDDFAAMCTSLRSKRNR